MLNKVPCHEEVPGEWWKSGRHFILGTRRRLTVSFTPQPLYHRRKSLRYPLERRLGGAQSQY
jgi:hypothetical protein